MSYDGRYGEPGPVGPTCRCGHERYRHHGHVGKCRQKKCKCLKFFRREEGE